MQERQLQGRVLPQAGRGTLHVYLLQGEQVTAPYYPVSHSKFPPHLSSLLAFTYSLLPTLQVNLIVECLEKLPVGWANELHDHWPG